MDSKKLIEYFYKNKISFKITEYIEDNEDENNEYEYEYDPFAFQNENKMYKLYFDGNIPIEYKDFILESDDTEFDKLIKNYELIKDMLNNGCYLGYNIFIKSLNNFIIYKFHKNSTVNLKFIDNKLILVGENGTGKSTILRILYAFLTNTIYVLFNEEFESIKLVFNENKIIKMEKKDIVSKFRNNSISISNIKRYFPVHISRKILSFIDDFAMMTDSIDYDELIEILNNNFNNRDNSFIMNKLFYNTNIKIINVLTPIKYFPTYRLVEREISLNDDDTILYSSTRSNMDVEKLSNNKEIIENGMKRIDKYISDYISDIKRKADDSATKLNYQSFKDILNEEYKKDIQNLNKYNINDIDKVFNSINSIILTEKEKREIKDKLVKIIEKDSQDNNDYNKIVLFFYNKLYKRFQEIKESEKNIIEYFELCNKYLFNKKLQYIEQEFTYKIILENDKDANIILSDLSSGEKQIILMFAYLYVVDILYNSYDYNNELLLIIDEPELSLSTKWQRNFLLDISKSKKCIGLVAATHSPFIFDNELSKYTFYLGDFTDNTGRKYE